MSPDSQRPRFEARFQGGSLPARRAIVPEAASFLVPWFVALATLWPGSRFGDDAPLLRSLGNLPLGFQGLVSSGLGALFDFLPLGSRALRTSFVAALGLGVLSWLVYRATLACQGALNEKDDPRLRAALALAAALSAALGPCFLEGTAPGGAALGAALALASTLVGTGVFGRDGRTPLATGILLGATLLEARAGFFAALVALAAHAALQAFARRKGWSESGWASAAFGLLALSVLPAALIVTAFVRPSLGLEVALGVQGADTTRLGVEGSSALRAWAASTGLFWCGVSLFGLALGLFRASTRPWLVALTALFLVDAALAETRAVSLTDPLKAVRLLGIAALAVGGPLGVMLVLRTLRRERIPFYRPVSTLLVVYAFTLAFVSAEASSRAADARATSAADPLTDELWQSLPPRAVLLVRSEPLLLRLLAGRLTRGTRPDVLVVSMPHFERGGAQAYTLARDPALIPLVRDLLLTGQPSEFALSALADTRPLYVQPDLTWDARLFGHLVPRPFFGEFASHPVGRSDRSAGLERAARTDARVRALVRESDGDPAPRAWVARGFRERGVVFASLGDRELARAAVNDLLTLLPEDALGLQLKAKLDEPGRGPLAPSEFAVR